MAYLVRKINKPNSIKSFGTAADVASMDADAATAEFRTAKGTLSTWGISSIDEVCNAALAIASTSTKIDDFFVVIINTDWINQNDLEFNKTYAGVEIPIPEMQDTHYDIVGISNEKLINCSRIYQKVYQEDNNQAKYIVSFTRTEILDLLKQAVKEGRVKTDLLNKAAKSAIGI